MHLINRNFSGSSAKIWQGARIQDTCRYGMAQKGKSRKYIVKRELHFSRVLKCTMVRRKDMATVIP